MSRGKYHRIAAGAVLLLIVILWKGNCSIVKADIAPPPPPEGGNISPEQAGTQVRMMSETVLVDIASTTGNQDPYARVTASFTMRNLGQQAEQMNVRFPLNLLFPQYQSDLEECPYPSSNYPEISDFRAKVNGKPASITTLYKRMEDPYGTKPARDVACWASFPVSFPPDQDVTIEVGYTAAGYLAWYVNGLVEFPYVMVTGEGWAGTIGSADITIRTPFEINEQNVFDYYPEDIVIEGRELRWHIEDEEPGSNISATIVNPVLWDKIEKERQNVTRNDKDGEAWGRLGKACKEAITLSRGHRWDEGGADLYWESRAAYEKAVTLLPKDADWHYGYSELVWWNALFESYGSHIQQRDDLVKAVEQIRLALEINPRHVKALELLEAAGGWYSWDESHEPVIDLSGPKPDYLALTTTPTARLESTAMPTVTPEATATVLPSAEAQASATSLPEPSSTPTAAEVAEAVEDMVEEMEPAAPPMEKTGGKRMCGTAFLPLFMAVVLALSRRKYHLWGLPK